LFVAQVQTVMTNAGLRLRRGAPVPALVSLGWREWLSLPTLGVAAIRAKIDTGARSSALHVDSLEVVWRGNVERVTFSLDPDNAGTPVHCEADVIGRRPVTDSGGHTSERVFIHTDLAIAGQLLPIEINLTSRRNMLFPMLLGRTAMAGRFVVDPAASFLLGEPEPPAQGVLPLFEHQP
jgi:hypothetical protein